MERSTSRTHDTPLSRRHRVVMSRQVIDDIEWSVTWGIVIAMVIGGAVAWFLIVAPLGG